MSSVGEKGSKGEAYNHLNISKGYNLQCLKCAG